MKPEKTPIINDGGPAFPITEQGLQGYNGMSLRDWFAGQALAGLAAASAHPHGPSFREVPALADELAGKMIAAREAKQ